MKVAILAGGLGIRISEETHLKPKPILWHILKTYSVHGNTLLLITCTVEFCSACYEYGKQYPEDCNVINVCAMLPESV